MKGHIITWDPLDLNNIQGGWLDIPLGYGALILGPPVEYTGTVIHRGGGWGGIAGHHRVQNLQHRSKLLLIINSIGLYFGATHYFFTVGPRGHVYKL